MEMLFSLVNRSLLVTVAVAVLLIHGPAIASSPIEVLLEFAPADQVLQLLVPQFPDVVFTPHPTMNGFYLRGTRKEILAIKALVPDLDHPALPLDFSKG